MNDTYLKQREVLFFCLDFMIMVTVGQQGDGAEGYCTDTG